MVSSSKKLMATGLITVADLNCLHSRDAMSTTPAIPSTPKRKAGDGDVATSDGCVTPDIAPFKVVKDQQQQQQQPRETAVSEQKQQQQPKATKKPKNGEPRSQESPVN